MYRKSKLPENPNSGLLQGFFEKTRVKRESRVKKTFVPPLPTSHRFRTSGFMVLCVNPPLFLLGVPVVRRLTATARVGVTAWESRRQQLQRPKCQWKLHPDLPHPPHTGIYTRPERQQ